MAVPPREGRRPKRQKLSHAHQDDEEEEEEDDVQSKVLLLENQISESRKNYNNIATLLDYLDGSTVKSEIAILAAVALCRSFCRLLAAGALDQAKTLSEKETTVVRWLGDKLDTFYVSLSQLLQSDDEPVKQSTALTLLFRLMKEEGKAKLSSSANAGTDVWTKGRFARVLRTVVTSSQCQIICEEFVEKFAVEYVDIEYSTLEQLKDVLSAKGSNVEVDTVISILGSVIPSENPEDDDRELFFESIISPKRQLEVRSTKARAKYVQQAWISLLRRDLDKSQRKRILELISPVLGPWFSRPEVLLDFLTDSINQGGSTALLSLSGLFFLIQHRNLDYPHFYTKLYSMLDRDILHSKHRSRFFRLLDTFLASTHLPAALVASFIKRLARLCLTAPPSGIVIVVPWIYNLLKRHPMCTFMIQRSSFSGRSDSAQDPYTDPFKFDEPNAMETGALESSLWEIVTLQSHYHPNVAAIAKIISEQFTRREYNLEDFLDHSYATLLDAELSKEVKKEPAVEYVIPKRIVVGEEKGSDADGDSLMLGLWQF